jgi:peroxiredoxin
VCSLEFPDLELNIYKKFSRDDVVVVGVNPDPKLNGGETPATLEMFAKQTKVTFPMGLDASESYRAFEYGEAISPFPLDVIVAPDGTIAYAKREYDAGEMTAVIEKLLDAR